MAEAEACLAISSWQTGCIEQDGTNLNDQGLVWSKHRPGPRTGALRDERHAGFGHRSGCELASPAEYMNLGRIYRLEKRRIPVPEMRGFLTRAATTEAVKQPARLRRSLDKIESLRPPPEQNLTKLCWAASPQSQRRANEEEARVAVSVMTEPVRLGPWDLKRIGTCNKTDI